MSAVARLGLAWPHGRGESLGPPPSPSPRRPRGTVASAWSCCHLAVRPHLAKPVACLEPLTVP